MPSVFEWIHLQNPVAALFVALTGTALGIGSLLAFIMGRRTIRRRYFARRDRRSQFIRRNWDKIVRGEIPAEQWFFDAIDHPLVEEIVLDRMDIASTPELTQLQQFVRVSGLLDRRIREARRCKGWRRRQALLALGRMRVHESIPALTAALRESDEATVVDAIQALGQVGTPRAGEAILQRISDKQVRCPPETLQTALLNSYRFHAPTLLGKVLQSDDAVRPTLARVLAEISTPGMAGDLLSLAADPLAEVRASAARILAVARPHYAINALIRLAADEEWFVRLRAAVAIGDLTERRGIPALIRALCDRNRLVRLRAASSLTCFRGQEEQILQLAMQTGNRYALQVLVSEMERSGRIPELVCGLAYADRRDVIESALLTALEGGSMRILADLLLNHPDRRVRSRLARLLAGSGEPGLLHELEQIYLILATPRQARVLRWIIARLRRAVESTETARAAVAV